MKQEIILRSALSDILKGYSFCDGIYIKHLKLDDYVDYELKYEEYFAHLQKRGMETEEVLLQRVTKQGLWSAEKDEELEYLTTKTQTLEKSLNGLMGAKEMRDEYDKQLKKYSEEQKYLSLIKFSLTQHSVENKTQEKLNQYYVLNSLCKDKNLEIPYLSEEEKDDPEISLTPLIKTYNKAIEKLNRDNIKKIAIKDFFRQSWDLVDNAFYFFGRPICELTYHQQDLSVYAEIFGNIFKNFPNIDKNAEPDIIIKAAERQSQLRDKGGNRSINGMSDAEARAAGASPPDKSKMFEEALAKKNAQKSKEN